MSLNLLVRSLTSFRGISPLDAIKRSYSVIYTANCTASNTRAVCDDNPKHLEVKLTKPKQLGGDGAEGTNPEELFAAGYSSCFLAAMGVAAKTLRKPFPIASSVSAAVDIGKHENGYYGFRVNLTARLPGMTPNDADAVVKAAHYICPYSHATRNNVDVKITTLT